jgi:hypothetical protein
MLVWEGKVKEANERERPDYVLFPDGEPQEEHESPASLIIATFVLVIVMVVLWMVPWNEFWEAF